MSRADRENRATETKIASFTYPSADNSPRLDRLQILITDDNPTNRKLLRVLLEAEGHSTLEADNGVAALELLKQYSVDAVISDILMPEMDGYRLCYEIRKNPTLNPIPFIVYTATYISPSDEKVGLDFGADKFIVKPAPPEVIINALYEVVESTRGRRAKELKQPQELLVMREYSEALVRKLEETNLDLTEANKALAESENHLRTILDSEPECVTIINRDGALVDINRAGLQVFEADSTEQLVGKSVYPLIVPGHRQAFREITEAVLRGESRTLELEVVGFKGTRRWLETHAVPLKNTNGEIISSLHITRDTTESKRAEEALAQISLEGIQGTRARVVKDLAIISGLSVLVFVATMYLELFETLSDWVLVHKETELDELVTVLVFLAFAFAFFSYRRWRELKTEVIGRRKAEAALRMLHGELEMRVQERTADVAKSNETLRAEITERKRAQEMAQINLERIRALHEIDVAISSTLDINAVLQVLLEKIELFLPFPAATTIRLFDPGTQEFENTACRNLNEHEWKAGTRRRTGELSKEILKTDGPIVVEDIQTDTQRRTSEFFRRHGFISYLGVTLMAKGEVVGILGFYTRTAHEFTQQETEFLHTIAGQAAIGIHNARLYQETQRRRREAEELARVARSLTDTLDMTVVGERIVMSVRELFGVQGSTLRLRQADGSLRRLASSGEVFSQTSVGDAVPSGVGLTNRAIADGIPIWSSDILNNSEIVLTDEMRDYQIRSGNRSMIVVPLRAHEKLIGTLTLSDRTGRIYSDNEVSLLQTFADQAALALENARLFEEIGHSNTELEKTTQYLAKSLKQLGGLYTALSPIAPAASTQEMVDGIIERLIDATSSDAALIRVWDKKADRYPFISQRGFPDSYLKAVEAAPSGGAVDWVVKHIQPIIAPDIASESRFKGKIQLQSGLRSCAMLPLTVDDEVRGVMHIASRKLGYFDEEQRDHLLTIARQMSIALENRELFYDLKSSRDELERANKVKDEFLSVMSHELRTPLNVIMGYTGLLKGAMLGEINPKQMDATSKILGQCRDLLVMVNSILQATQLGSAETKVFRRECSLSDLLDELKSSYAIPQAKELTISWDYPAMLPTVETDEEKLRHILQNLINNATKFTEKGQVVISARVIDGGMQEGENRKQVAESSEQLPAASDQQGGKRWLEFQVADTGVGIPQEQLPVIFDMFRQVDSSETRPYGGTGLGLYIVKKYLDLLGGKVEVESELGRGSTFTVVIPCEVEIDCFQPTEATR